MNMIKESLRELLIFLHLDLTKNLKYDRLTRQIMKTHLKKDSNCIDVGCHKGEILNLMLHYAPKGKHYAFEPIPFLYKEVANKYSNKAKIFTCALSNKDGETTFQLVKNAPAYSGIMKRRYDIANPEIEEISVQMKMLDGIIPSTEKIDFLKIDVEGGEFDVLKGGKNLLKESKPIILFECGKGASDYYGTTADAIYDFIEDELGLVIYTLSNFLKRKDAMNVVDFAHYFNTNEEYYFVAAPKI